MNLSKAPLNYRLATVFVWVLVLSSLMNEQVLTLVFGEYQGYQTIILFATPLILITSLYVWLSFWKIIRIHCGFRDIDPFLLMIIGIESIALIVFEVLQWNPDSKLVATIISALYYGVFIVFGLKLLKIPHDLFQRKYWFCISLIISYFMQFLFLSILTLELDIIQIIQTNLWIKAGFGLIFILSFFVYNVAWTQIFLRAANANPDLQNKFSQLIDEIGEENL